jgi:threonine aldolase
VIEALARVGEGHVPAYGDDEHTARAVSVLRDLFGSRAEVFFVFNGTGANVTALSAVARPHHAVVCAETAHINTDECGAPERICGCKLLPVATSDGKLTPELVATRLQGFGNEHHSQPRVVSITQVSELGTVYTPGEIRALADQAHEHGMVLHMDGARVSNAAAALYAPLASFTTEAGVDVLSLGGTKNGMLMGEAVVFLDPALAQGFKFVRKSAAQLSSKTRFISAQFEALYGSGLWLELASHANRMAALLAERVRDVRGVRITQAVQANEVFAELPPGAAEPLLAERAFYV